jgi:hypothetical protein
LEANQNGGHVTIVEMDVTADQLLQLVAALAEPSCSGGLTAREIADRLHLSTYQVHTILHQLKGQGKLVCRKGTREYIDGRYGFVPVYFLQE